MEEKYKKARWTDRKVATRKTSICWSLWPSPINSTPTDNMRLSDRNQSKKRK
jgi:hypothetical protein